MSEAAEHWTRRRPAIAEGMIITLAGYAAMMAIPLSLGGIGIGWDALNHHFYLGWTAEHPRFNRDFLAASYQSFQFPYLYWPAYKLAALGASGTLAGVVLAGLHALAVPGVWLLARRCIPGDALIDVALRVLAVILGFSSIVVLSLFDSTSNDLLAAIPLVWSIALAAQAIPYDEPVVRNQFPVIALSGVCAGVAVACKLSNGPLAALLPILWMASAGSLRQAVLLALAGSAATVSAFAIAYGYWGWQLWQAVGNPFYPFCDACWLPLRTWTAWQP